jgi:inorganic pyrophosphatase
MTNLAKLPAFLDGKSFHVVIESPRGSAVKLKYDAKLEVMSISRPLPVGLVYPYDFGFIPSTKALDGDPVDALVLWDVPTFPGVVIECRALGVIHVEQNRTNFDSKQRIRNDRILAIPTVHKREPVGPLTGSGWPRIQEEIANFLTAVTILEGKDATILGWAGADDAIALIRRSLRRRR